MNQVIERLKLERDEVLEHIKYGEEQEIELLIELKQAIRWLELLKQHELNDPGNYTLHTLPTLSGHGFYEYRIMVDNESNDRNCWDIYQPEGNDRHGMTLNCGDLIVKRK